MRALQGINCTAVGIAHPKNWERRKNGYTGREGQNHHMLMILKSKSNHLNKGYLKSKNHFGSGNLKIKITLKIK